MAKGDSEFYSDEMHPRARGYMIATATAYGCLAFALILGPEQWTRTESYSLLEHVAPFWVWGVVFGVGAVAAGFAAVWSWPKLRVAVVPFIAAASAAWAVGMILAGLTHRLEGIGAPIVWTYVTVLHVLEAGRPSYRPLRVSQIEEVFERLT